MFCLVGMLLVDMSGNPGYTEPDAQYPEIKLSRPISRAIQKTTGLTALSRIVGNHLLQKELGKKISGDLKVRLKPYSATDLLAGRVQSIEVSGQHLMLDNGLQLEDFQLETDRHWPIILSNTKRPVLTRPVQLKISATVSETGINHLLQSKKGQEMLSGIKVQLPPFGPQYLDALEPSVTLHPDLVHMRSMVNVHGAPLENAFPIEIRGRVIPDKSRLQLGDLALNIEGIEDTRAIEQFIETYFGEIANLERIKIKNHHLNIIVEQCLLQEKQVSLTANVTIRPGKKTTSN